MNIIIGISWPFANGELHIGHAASSLPADAYVYDSNDKNNSEKYINLTQGEDYFHYTFVMPAYCVKPAYTDT